MRPDVSRLRLVVELALREFVHERVMSACFVLSLSAVLLPLLVLFGLKFGIIGNLLEPLKEDPRYRQILPAGSGSYGPDWFAAMAARADVAFIVPRTRAIAATMRLRAVDTETGRIISVELIPSAAGDPVLSGLEPPQAYATVALSLDAADKLGVSAGDAVEGILTRTLGGEQQTVLVPLIVGAVAPAAAFARDGMFVAHELLMAVEDFRDGRAVAPLGWSGAAAVDGPRYFAGFRLYARSIDDVAALREGLMNQGIDVRSRVADIELVKTLDRNLSVVFWIIAGIAAVGYGLAFGSSVWANVDRKRLEFGVLRLTGFRTSSIVWFPILQAMLTGALGWLVATLFFFIVQAGLNALFADTVGGGESVCMLLPAHFILALVLTLAAASVAAASGGRRLAKLEPSLALREA
ncbi:MAG: FtsX-like permease family protein [Gammaproteobacteria bacterium]|nr:FtsX-like permease family protein [Gammaproteobacteria bacterium]